MKEVTGQIKVGQSVEIQNLVISDPQVVAAVAAAKAENRDLVEYLTSAVELGVKALQITGVSLGVDQLADAFTSAKDSINTVAKSTTDDLKKYLKEITSKESPFAKVVEESLTNFESGLAELTGGEDSPIREGIKRELDGLSRSVLDGFSRMAKNQKEDLAKLLDIESPQSPLRLLSNHMRNIGDAVEVIKSKMDQEVGAQLEMQKSTRKGLPYEKAAIDAVSEIANRSNDEPLATGGTPGRGAAKKGDGVIGLREGLTVKAKLVVEAKNMSSMKTDGARRRYWLNQAEGARRNRGAVGFLGLCKNIEDMPGKRRIIALDQLGQNLVLAYDPDRDEDEFLALVYQVVKMHCLSALSNGRDINPVALNAYVQNSLDMLEKFNDIEDSVGKIKTQADNIRSVSEAIKDALTTHLKSIRREVSGSVEQITLEPADPFELESLDESDFDFEDDLEDSEDK
jgi:hypothetical protein